MKKKEVVILLFALLIGVVACKKTDTEDPSRLFRPVLAGTLLADSNTIVASWQKIKGSVSYTLQLSRDAFGTVDISVNVPDTFGAAVIKNLKFDQLYQVRVKANAADTTLSSKWSDLGSIKTLTSILKTPGPTEVIFNAVRVSWTTKGAPVTSVRIIKTSDSSTVRTVLLTPLNVTNEFVVVNGLTASTKYTILLYSGTDVRGYADFITKPPYSGSVIDLSGITGRPSVLADTLGIIPSGSTVLLKRGETYNIATAINLSKSVTITSVPDLLVLEQSIISMPANLNITAGSTIDSIVFNDVTLRGTDYASKYVFNINTACTIGKMSFLSCKAEIFRGIVRTQTSTATIGNFLVDNCILDSLAGYGVLTVDVVTSKVDNITIRNSTIYKAEKIIVSRNNSTAVTMENCTVNEAPLGGGTSYYVDYNTAGTNNVTNGITINNCLFGVGKLSAGLQTVRGVRANTGQNILASNNYRTSDQVSLAGNDIPNIMTHTRPTTQLWQDPQNGNFKIIDNTFLGRSTTGDLRWRIN